MDLISDSAVEAIKTAHGYTPSFQPLVYSTPYRAVIIARPSVFANRGCDVIGERDYGNGHTDFVCEVQGHRLGFTRDELRGKLP